MANVVILEDNPEIAGLYEQIRYFSSTRRASSMMYPKQLATCIVIALIW